jgi:hypothetical protein
MEIISTRSLNNQEENKEKSNIGLSPEDHTFQVERCFTDFD